MFVPFGIIEITIISATLHDCQTDQVPSVQDDMIVQRKDVEFHVYSYRALPVLPSLPFPSFPGDRWGGVVAPRCAKLSPTLHGFPLCSSLSSSLATAKQRHHHQQQRRHHDSTLGSLGSHSAFHVLERCSKGTRWGFIIADLPTLLRCHSLGSHMPRWGATCHMLGVQRVRCGANTAWVSSSLGVLLLRCGCHAGRRGTRWGMT